MEVRTEIDGKGFLVPEGISVRKAALNNNIYIPGICDHPDLPPASKVRWKDKIFQGEEVICGNFPSEMAGEQASCDLCVVEIAGREKLERSCETMVENNMMVCTTNEDIIRHRKRALSKILSRHPHACLTCAQREGCSLTQCSSNVPEAERCCILLNRCELGKIADYIGIPDETPKYIPGKSTKILEDPFFERDYNLCIGCLRCVRICKDLRGVEALGATIIDGSVRVGAINPGLLDKSFCRYCSACVELCPTGALIDKPDSKPVRYGEDPPCMKACPANIDIPEYLKKTAEGDYSGALKSIYLSVPFPGILGYICFHPCENECKRGILDESVAICAIKRSLYEKVSKSELRKLTPGTDRGKRVAIVGAGPAGLTAAFYLTKAGHSVEIYDSASKPGGMLRYAIPEYRLPETVIDEELRALSQLGVNFIHNIELGKDIRLAELLDGRYDAVLLAIGANLSKGLEVKGADLPQVYLALDFLNSIKTGTPLFLSGRVIVIGGGNVAIDAAMSARRSGAESVGIICLEKKEEMPAHLWEIQQAKQEGISIHTCWGPAEFVAENGKLVGVKLKRCLNVFDQSGKFKPEYDEGETTFAEADFAILAIGQYVRTEALDDDIRSKICSGDKVTVLKNSMQTGIPGLFAAGDILRGQGSVVEAMAEGKKAAGEIDIFLGSKGIFNDGEFKMSKNDPYLGRDENYLNFRPIRPGQLNPIERISGFELIEGTFSAEEARAEAYRCLRCNLRANITPAVLPPEKWQILNIEAVNIVPEIEGVYQIANRDRKVIKISGCANLRAGLQKELSKRSEEVLFCWEQDKMYSKRESELLQKHLQEYGQMPGGADELEDLF